MTIREFRVAIAIFGSMLDLASGNFVLRSRAVRREDLPLRFLS
jgi:hypothetical protein